MRRAVLFKECRKSLFFLDNRIWQKNRDVSAMIGVIVSGPGCRGKEKDMVEKIVQKNEEVTETGNGWFRLPKHVRQMGLSGNSPEIYIEDYAEGYLRRLAGSDYTECRVAVLVGEFIKFEGKRYVFIRGAIEAEEVWKDNSVCFTSEVWANVYEKIKRYFPQYEAVGWFLGGPEFLTEVTEEIRQIHVDWFGGRDRVLYKIDPVEKEAVFYLYDKGDLKQWPGYSIYYEKNEEMQDYLVAEAPPSVDAGYTEPVLAEISKKVGRKEETEEEEKKEPSEKAEKTERDKKPAESATEKRPVKSSSGHGAGIAAAIALLAIGAFALKENELGEIWNNGAGLTPVPGPTAEVSFREEQEGQALPANAGGEAVLSPGAQKEIKGSVFEEDFIPVTEVPYLLGDEDTREDTVKLTETPTEKPEPTPTPVTEAADTEPLNLKVYVVRKGDTLAGICRGFYGNLERMEEIMGINQIADEDWIYAGQELYLP